MGNALVNITAHAWVSTVHIYKYLSIHLNAYIRTAQHSGSDYGPTEIMSVEKEIYAKGLT